MFLRAMHQLSDTKEACLQCSSQTTSFAQCVPHVDLEHAPCSHGAGRHGSSDAQPVFCAFWFAT